jgi:cell division protein FtsW
VRIRTDWRLLGTILLMLFFGLVMVCSASSVVAQVLFRKETWEFAVKQIGFALFGLLCLFVVKSVDYRRLKHPIWAFAPLVMVVVLLILVIPADPASSRWFHILGIQLQPSELAKPVLVLFLAYFVARRENAINDKHTLGPAAIVVAMFAGLIGYADLGTAAVILAPAAVVFFVAGIERRYFYVTIALAILLGAGAIYQKPYRLIRVLSFAGITEKKIQTDPKYQWMAGLLGDSKATRDADHQPRQAKLAVGSGGPFGVGINNSNQKLGFLPEAHTDFIFGVVAEETGLIGSTLLLAGYLYIFWRGMRLYWITPDVFGKYLALGAVTLFAAQAMFNMSVVVGIAPTKGIPLPLISYGGSSMVTTLITLGMLLSVSEHSGDGATV